MAAHLIAPIAPIPNSSQALVERLLRPLARATDDAMHRLDLAIDPEPEDDDAPVAEASPALVDSAPVAARHGTPQTLSAGAQRSGVSARAAQPSARIASQVQPTEGPSVASPVPVGDAPGPAASPGQSQSCPGERAHATAPADATTGRQTEALPDAHARTLKVRPAGPGGLRAPGADPTDAAPAATQDDQHTRVHAPAEPGVMSTTARTPEAQTPRDTRAVVGQEPASAAPRLVVEAQQAIGQGVVQVQASASHLPGDGAGAPVGPGSSRADTADGPAHPRTSAPSAEPPQPLPAPGAVAVPPSAEPGSSPAVQRPGLRVVSRAASSQRSLAGALDSRLPAPEPADVAPAATAALDDSPPAPPPTALAAAPRPLRLLADRLDRAMAPVLDRAQDVAALADDDDAAGGIAGAAPARISNTFNVKVALGGGAGSLDPRQIEEALSDALRATVRRQGLLP